MNEQLAANSKPEELREQIAKSREEKKELSGELEEIDEQITFISSMANILAEVTTKEKHLEKRESEAKRIKNKHYDSFQHLFAGEQIESNFKRKIDTMSQQLRTEVNKLEAEIRLKENQVQGHKAQLQSKKQELGRYENELRKLEEDIDQVCEQMPFVDVLAATKDNVAKYQMEHSSFKSSELFYRK